MADQKNSIKDPLSAWREWMAQSESQLNTLLNEVMATDGYNRVVGRLTKVSVSMQKGMVEAMERYFTALSLPTRTDVMDLGQRLTMIETRLHSIESSLARMTGASVNDAEPIAVMPRPPRTRKPASGKGGVS